jgi:hypothetical protein
MQVSGLGTVTLRQTLKGKSWTGRRTSMEQVDELRRPEAKTRLMYRIVCWGSGITILASIAYGILTSALFSSGGVLDVGANLVNVDFPAPFFAKPVTYLSIACVTFFYTGLRLWQNRVAQWPQITLAFLQLFAIVVAFASAYEVLYNFMLWGAFFGAQLLQIAVNPALANPNIVVGPGPVPWNLVFATKMFSALFVISGYSVYFLRRIHQGRGLSDVL